MDRDGSQGDQKSHRQNDDSKPNPAPESHAAHTTPPQQPRRTAENLPPPTIFLLLFCIFGLYILFAPWQSESSPGNSSDVETVLVTAAPILATSTSTSTFTSISTLRVVETLTVETTKAVAAEVEPALVREEQDVKKERAKKQSEEKNQEVAMASTEQTFIAIKPDGVQRGLVGPIISRFENRGFKLVAIKLMSPSKEHLETHYEDLKAKPFFPGLISYMLSGPICAMVWEGRDAVKTGRTILGATNPLASAPGTIRGDFAIDVGRNVCHGSDSVENAKKEIALWFKDSDLVSWKSAQFDWVYEKA